MAMTKKDLAEMERLQRELRIVSALRWTEDVKPDVPPPETSSGLTKGWLPNPYSMYVAKACSSGVSHSIGRDDKTESQGARALYSTRLLALQALRYAVTREAAEKLAAINRAIELDTATPDQASAIHINYGARI